MQIAGRKALVIGAARSGIASARFLIQRGATVALNDRKPLSEWAQGALDLKTEGVGLIEGDPPSWLLDQIDLVVVSPGVPTKSIPIRYADRRGAEVIGEVELASRFLRGRTVAITGSNGKTTTTSLIGEMLKDAGLNVQVGGNIGTALISMIDSSRDDGWNVVELSSFQLETIVDFHPTVAAVLNVTPNHMDRYESLMDYAAAKHNIFRNQTPSDVAILNADDEIVSSWANGLRAHVAQFSVKKELADGLFLRGQDFVSRTKDGERVLATRDEMQLRGTQAPYAPLVPLIREQVRRMILIGEDAPVIEKEVNGAAPFERAADMGDAVARAFAAAKPGDVVLLAPACASFDMFESFEHRG